MQNYGINKSKKVILKKIYILAAFIALTTAPLLSSAQEAEPSKVMVMKIRAEIDPRMNRYVELALEHATETEADYVIVDMDTYGGAVTDAKDIVENIMNFKKPVWVFINKDAASAGALISISCDSIYMAPGANIGAATVVTSDGAAAPDKYQSYMRSTMRSIAEENGRNPQIAEAMVDQSLEVDSVSKAGQVITFSTTEAIKYGFCEGKVNSINEILEKNGVTNYTIDEYELGTTEKVIAIFLNPFISGILILVIIGGIWFELQTPGVGFPIAAAILASILYFVPYYLNGLAANWEIICFVIGIILIAMEVFVIPGFGVAGVLGITLTLGSLILVMLNNDIFNFSFVGMNALLVAVIATLGAFLGSLILLFVGGVKLTESKAFASIALTDTMDKKEGYTSNFKKESMIGRKGKAYTVLRPSGKVIIEDEIYDAYTRGDYISNGEKIIVTSDEGTSLKVKLDQ
ncbi:NfeD family protein [Fulvivirga sediminis]|uniref:Nodulation protein NfeD n=1 Tax=Fulvivirga sediminis TaxID=2803949 RepID=A0A937JZ11_9BACT|nr:nodulation protein NfeD [Fulvivirga sediminis]MBL3656214.1 nodulation protein NfeD [Fulvivirga sediminis]